MKLKLKKTIMASALALSICGTLFAASKASALSITNKGVKQYSGVFAKEAFAWTGADEVCHVNATAVNASNWAVITTANDTDGYVQTEQDSFSLLGNAMGMHSATSGGINVSDRSWP